MKTRIVRALAVAAITLGILAAGTAPAMRPGTLSAPTTTSQR